MKVIGIAGGTASGKTTLAREVHRQLEENGIASEVIGLDTFFIREMSVAKTVTVEPYGTFVNFNHPDSVDWIGLKQAVRQSDADVVIVEGHLLFVHAGMEINWTYRAFVDLAADVRFIRRLLRDMAGGRMSADPVFIAQYYLACAKPGHDEFVEPSRTHADEVFDGSAPTAMLAEALLRKI